MVIFPRAFTLDGQTGNSGRYLSLLKVSKCSLKITVKHISALHVARRTCIRTENTVLSIVILAQSIQSYNQQFYYKLFRYEINNC